MDNFEKVVIRDGGDYNEGAYYVFPIEKLPLWEKFLNEDGFIEYLDPVQHQEFEKIFGGHEIDYLEGLVLYQKLN